MRPYTYPQAPADQRPQPEYIPPTPPAQAAKKVVSPLMRPLTALGEMTKLPKFVTNAVRDPAAAGPAYDDPHALATAQRLRVSFEDFIEHTAAQIPVGRVGQPEDIAATIAFLVSEEAGFVSGQVVYVAGGPLD